MENMKRACTKHIYQTENNQFRKLDKVCKTNMRHNFSDKICPRKGNEQQIKNHMFPFESFDTDKCKYWYADILAICTFLSCTGGVKKKSNVFFVKKLLW